MEGPQGGPPPQPPTAWQHMLHAIGGVVHFFGRLSFLVDENAHAFHFFISSLLQLLDRCDLLQGSDLKESPQNFAQVACDRQSRRPQAVGGVLAKYRYKKLGLLRFLTLSQRMAPKLKPLLA